MELVVATVTAGSSKIAVNPAQLREGTLVELFFHGVDRKLPNAQMYRTSEGWRSVSHDQLLDNVRSLSAALASMGVGRGDRVALMCENRPEWPLVDYSLLCL